MVALHFSLGVGHFSPRGIECRNKLGGLTHITRSRRPPIQTIYCIVIDLGSVLPNLLDPKTASNELPTPESIGTVRAFRENFTHCYSFGERVLIFFSNTILYKDIY